MQKLIDGMTLYHGSYCEVKQPEIQQGARYKDFGQGFYLTSSKEQAKSFIKTSVKKAALSGKIANDNTNATIAAYMALAYGEIGTKSADDMCISLLLPERLQDQFCFRTDTALESVVFVESEQIWL